MAVFPLEMGQNQQLSLQSSGSDKKSECGKQTNKHLHKLNFNKEIGSIKRVQMDQNFTDKNIF